ncbi:MAG: hypothetical protein LIP10_09485 [Clostridiales bacterium]|nr:hypothetical protein [Clostridiales bacterium]
MALAVKPIEKIVVNRKQMLPINKTKPKTVKVRISAKPAKKSSGKTAFHKRNKLAESMTLDEMLEASYVLDCWVNEDVVVLADSKKARAYVKGITGTKRTSASVKMAKRAKIILSDQIVSTNKRNANKIKGENLYLSLMNESD